MMKKILFILLVALLGACEKDDSFIRPGVLEAVPHDANECTFTLHSSSAWEITSDANWCTLSPMSGTVNDTLVTVTVEENPGKDVRCANFTITNNDGESYALSLKQYGYAEHSVLVYLGMDNNFSAQCRQIMYMLTENWKPSYNGNLLVFADVKGCDALLMRITSRNYETVVDTIENYGNINSAASETLHTVLQKMMDEYPAKSYGLSVLSHGTGFISNAALSKPEGASSSSVSPQYIIVDQTPTNTFMDIHDFAEAIPDKLEYVLFDACFMGGIEVAYALKDKVKYIVGSPCEVVVSTSYSTNYEGSPYGLIYNKMMDRVIATEPDVVGVATDYYEYYKKYNYHASIAVVETEPLEDFAEYVSRKLKGVDIEENVDLSKVQNFGGNKRLFFDFADYYDDLYPDDETFAAKLEACIKYKANTSKYYTQFPSGYCFDITTFCGFTNYVEQASFQAVNAEYRKTAWYKRIYGED